MEGPSEQLRAEVIDHVSSLAPADQRGGEASEVADYLLSRIVEDLGADVESSQATAELMVLARNSDDRRISDDQVEMAENVLRSVNEWASLASYVMASVYGPASPLPRRLAGWGRKAIAYLQRVTKILLTPLAAAAKVTGASSWSISIGFPWGLSIGLSWP